MDPYPGTRSDSRGLADEHDAGVLRGESGGVPGCGLDGLKKRSEDDIV